MVGCVGARWFAAGLLAALLAGCGKPDREKLLIGKWAPGLAGVAAMGIKLAPEAGSPLGGLGAAAAVGSMMIDFRRDKTFESLFAGHMVADTWTMNRQSGEVVLNATAARPLSRAPPLPARSRFSRRCGRSTWTPTTRGCISTRSTPPALPTPGRRAAAKGSRTAPRWSDTNRNAAGRVVDQTSSAIGAPSGRIRIGRFSRSWISVSGLIPRTRYIVARTSPGR